MSHSIDHQTLIKAAEQILEICDAGYREQLQREFWERFNELPNQHKNDRCRDPMHWVQLNWDAELLSKLTDAPMHQCKAALREAGQDLHARAIGLELLREMRDQVRRVAQQAQQYRAGRRSA